MRVRWLLILFLAGACRTASESAPPPQPHEASVKPGINASYFKEPDPNKWSGNFEVETREIYARREAIVARLGLRTDMVVADVGAGTGLFTVMFAKHAAKVYAEDIVPEFLGHIGERAAKDGLTNVTTVLGREDDVTLDADSVDLVFLCDVYHHFEYPRSSLASIHRALRDDGELIVIDFERVEGKSPAWVLEHVRADKSTVRGEIEAAGFELAREEKDLLTENYFLRFRKRR
jgi:SAM-dependent methyltransferase